MNENPFHNGKGELPLAKFSGRADLLRELDRMIHEDWFQYLIQGERGYGKTSVRVWLKERYANEPWILICPLDFGNFRPAGSSAGYEQLINRTAASFRESLSQKSLKGDILMKIKNAFGKLKIRIPLPLLPDGIEIAQNDLQQPGIKDFLKAVYEAIDNTQIETVVFIFDEISSRQSAESNETERWAWEYCADFVAQLAQFDVPRQTKRMAVILLTYPDDIYNVPIGLAPDRHLTGRFSLRPFDLTEIEKLIGDLCVSEGIQYDREFPPTVYRLSGGSPDLVQAIGYGAFRHAGGNRPSGAIVLNRAHANFAHASHGAIMEKAMGLARWKMPELRRWLTGGTPETIAFRKALKRLGELNMDQQHWHTRDEWITIGSRGDIDSQKLLAAFIDTSVERGLMVVEEEGNRLRFLGEILRHAVATIAAS